MGGYVVNFTVYTMAMIGLICFAVFVYKKIMDGGISKGSSKFLAIEESMSLSPRKTLHVVRAGNEKFLVASDVDRTTLISKLENPSEISAQDIPQNVFSEMLPPIEEIPVEPVNLEAQYAESRQPEAEFRVPAHNRQRQRRKDRSVVLMDFNRGGQVRKSSPMQEMAKRINNL